MPLFKIHHSTPGIVASRGNNPITLNYAIPKEINLNEPLDLSTFAPHSIFCLYKANPQFSGDCLTLYRSPTDSRGFGFTTDNQGKPLNKLDYDAIIRYASGGDLRVGKWKNQSSDSQFNNNHLTQGNFSQMPILVEAGEFIFDKNGLLCLKFTGNAYFSYPSVINVVDLSRRMEVWIGRGADATPLFGLNDTKTPPSNAIQVSNETNSTVIKQMSLIAGNSSMFSFAEGWTAETGELPEEVQFFGVSVDTLERSVCSDGKIDDRQPYNGSPLQGNGGMLIWLGATNQTVQSGSGHLKGLINSFVFNSLANQVKNGTQVYNTKLPFDGTVQDPLNWTTDKRPTWSVLPGVTFVADIQEKNSTTVPQGEYVFVESVGTLYQNKTGGGLELVNAEKFQSFDVTFPGDATRANLETQINASPLVSDDEILRMLDGDPDTFGTIPSTSYLQVDFNLSRTEVDADGIPIYCIRLTFTQDMPSFDMVLSRRLDSGGQDYFFPYPFKGKFESLFSSSPERTYTYLDQNKDKISLPDGSEQEIPKPTKIIGLYMGRLRGGALRVKDIDVFFENPDDSAIKFPGTVRANQLKSRNAFGNDIDPTNITYPQSPISRLDGTYTPTPGEESNYYFQAERRNGGLTYILLDNSDPVLDGVLKNSTKLIEVQSVGGRGGVEKEEGMMVAVNNDKKIYVYQGLQNGSVHEFNGIGDSVLLPSLGQSQKWGFGLMFSFEFQLKQDLDPSVQSYGIIGGVSNGVGAELLLELQNNPDGTKFMRLLGLNVGDTQWTVIISAEVTDLDLKQWNHFRVQTSTPALPTDPRNLSMSRFWINGAEAVKPVETPIALDFDKVILILGTGVSSNVPTLNSGIFAANHQTLNCSICDFWLSNLNSLEGYFPMDEGIYDFPQVTADITGYLKEKLS